MGAHGDRHTRQSISQDLSGGTSIKCGVSTAADALPMQAPSIILRPHAGGDAGGDRVDQQTLWHND